MIDRCSITPQNPRSWFEKLKLVSLPSTQTEKPRGEIKYSVLRVLIFMYIHCGEHFLKMNNHRRKRSPLCWSSALWEWNNCFSHISSYCNEILAVPDTEWQITPRFNHTSVRAGVGGAGGGWARGRGGQLAFVGKVWLSQVSPHKSFVSFSVLLTNSATFIKGLCHCTLIVLKWELLSEEREWIERNDL